MRSFLQCTYNSLPGRPCLYLLSMNFSPYMDNCTHTTPPPVNPIRSCLVYAPAHTLETHTLTRIRPQNSLLSDILSHDFPAACCLEQWIYPVCTTLQPPWMQFVAYLLPNQTFCAHVAHRSAFFTVCTTRSRPTTSFQHEPRGKFMYLETNHNGDVPHSHTESRHVVLIPIILGRAKLQPLNHPGSRC